MTIHTIVLIGSGIFTVFLTYKIQEKYSKNYYFLSMFIPILFLWVSVTIFSPDLLKTLSKALQKQEITEPSTVNNGKKLKTEELEILKKLESNAGNIKLTLDLADIYMAQDHLDKALDLIKNINNKHQNNKDINLKLGKAYFAKGLLYAENKEYEKALTYLQKALKISPKDAYFWSDIKYFINKTTLLSNDVPLYENK